MMSPSDIDHLAKEAEKKAKRNKLVPLVLGEVEDVDHLGQLGYRIPNFGDYRPKGWEMVEHWLCDKSGWGSENEPALTMRQLKERLKDKIREGKSYGYGTVEEGQFQVVLGVFEKVPAKRKKAKA